MKACRAPRTCHKATTEEDLSRIDTLAWTYPKADWPLQTCMSRHHNAGCHPRGEIMIIIMMGKIIIIMIMIIIELIVTTTPGATREVSDIIEHD